MVPNTHTATHLCRHTCTCSHVLSAHTSSRSHTYVLTCTHTFVYSHARGCVPNPHPRPAGWLVLKLLTARQLGKLRARLTLASEQQGRGPHLVPTPGGGRDTISPGGSCKEGPGGCWAGARETEGGESIPTALPGHGSLSWVCLSRSSFSLGSLNFFSVKLLFVEGSQCARCLARGPAGHPAALRGGCCSSPASLKRQCSPGPGE